MSDEKTKEELQAELRDRELPVSGTKDELAARLEAADAETDEAAAAPPAEGLSLADMAAPHVTPPQGSLAAHGLDTGTYVADDFLVRPGEALAAYKEGDEVPAAEIDKYGWHSKVHRTDEA